MTLPKGVKSRHGVHLPGYQPPNPPNRSEAGKEQQKYANNHRKYKFQRADFVGIDGEGMSFGDETRYTLFQTSEGQCIYNQEGITFWEIVKALFKINCNSIITIFSGNYDFNCWLYSLPEEIIRRLHKVGFVTISRDGVNYRVQLRPHKSLLVTKGSFNGQGKWIKDSGRSKYRSRQVFDVFGFFQQSFLGVIEKWVPGQYDEELLSWGKTQRVDFTPEDLEKAKKYNAEECRTLVLVMKKLHKLIASQGIVMKRWDGAGALAAALLEKYKVKDHVQGLIGYRTPLTRPEVEDILLNAYHGGRIEVFKEGHLIASEEGEENIFDYDARSAYPSEEVDLPSFERGVWAEWEPGMDDRYTISEVEWRPVDEEQLGKIIIGPLPYRTKWGTTIYPVMGRGWYHKPEVDALIRTAKKNHIEYKIHRTIAWLPGTKKLPFAFVEALYELRKRMKELGDEAEKIIKLALNSIYGKTAQTIGTKYETDKNGHRYKVGTGSPFLNFFWAGRITSGTRAKMYELALIRPKDVIAIQTDGLFIQGKLRLPSSILENRLGNFELKEDHTKSGYAEALILQAGIFSLRYGEEKWYDRTRGFGPPRTEEDWNEYREKLRLCCEVKGTKYPRESKKFVSLGQALASTKELKSYWTQWEIETKLLQCDNSGKRQVLEDWDKPWRKTKPIPPPRKEPLMSYPFNPKWKDVHEEVEDRFYEDEYIAIR